MTLWIPFRLYASMSAERMREGLPLLNKSKAVKAFRSVLRCVTGYYCIFTTCADL